MQKITTKTGDKGMTSLADGTRVAKDDVRIEFNGQVDELNAFLGLAKAQTGFVKQLEPLQEGLMTLMGIVACGRNELTDDEAQQLDALLSMMDCFIKARQDNAAFHFVLPGTNINNAVLHLARAKVRTCERLFVRLSRSHAKPSIMQQVLNRMSDYLFMMTELKE